MSSVDEARVLEQWIREQPGSYLHPDVHISNSDETGVHWRTSKEVDAGTRYAPSMTYDSDSSCELGVGSAQE